MIDAPIELMVGDEPSIVESLDLSSPEATIDEFLAAYETDDFYRVLLTMNPRKQRTLNDPRRPKFAPDYAVLGDDLDQTRFTNSFDIGMRVADGLGVHLIDFDTSFTVEPAVASELGVIVGLETPDGRLLDVHLDQHLSQWRIDSIVDRGESPPLLDVIVLEPQPEPIRSEGAPPANVELARYDLSTPTGAVAAFHDAYNRRDYHLVEMLVMGWDWQGLSGKVKEYGPDVAVAASDWRTLDDRLHTTTGDLLELMETTAIELGQRLFHVDGSLTLTDSTLVSVGDERPTVHVEGRRGDGVDVVFRVVRSELGHWRVDQISAAEDAALLGNDATRTDFWIGTRQCRLPDGFDYRTRPGVRCFDLEFVPSIEEAEDRAFRAFLCALMQGTESAVVRVEFERLMDEAVRSCPGDPSLVEFR